MKTPISTTTRTPEQRQADKLARIAADLANADRDTPIRARFNDWLEGAGFAPQATPHPGTTYPGAHTQTLWECYLAATLAERSTSTKPNLFWNDEDAEKCHHGIGEFLNDEICNGSLEVGDLRTLQRAVSLPKITIRITAIDENESDAEYEIVEAQGAKP